MNDAELVPSMPVMPDQKVKKKRPSDRPSNSSGKKHRGSDAAPRKRSNLNPGQHLPTDLKY